MRGIDYTPDFVIYDEDNSILHVYDVKTSLSDRGVDSGAKLRFIMWGFTQLGISCQLWEFLYKVDVHYDIHGKMKINKKTGQPIYDHYNVYKDINYDIHDLVGW